MRMIDAHCHFDFPRFDGGRAKALADARALGVLGAVIPGVRRPDWSRVRQVADAHRELWYCLGIHPWFVGEHRDEDLQALEDQLSARPERCVGLGECGLDRLHGTLDQQQPWFERQVAIAARLNLPLIVHSVKAHDEVHATLRRANWSGRALIHGFSGSYQQAAKLVDLGCYIGIGGVITHDRARKTRDTVARLPVDCLVLETDAPDMAPAGVEPGQNSPVYLPRILDDLAMLRGVDASAIAPQLLANVCSLYGWSEDDLPE
ncbi:TatD family hydrolase [Marinobacter pelagius]|uniref:TatD family hydrolase n=1 Tax=Marinobacter sp. C7 TaxID=2951363 RepID=UPI001EF0AD5C|nr:TatD family hydrolase [Marinobacter sp. C7]MCG7200933.1 TatD family hydrolase [Marinobacter sp. C7]